ncbi:MAG: T9SS type A sorting domain-containing protein [Chlorobi bacterium]|nr:T9SS type A sorting domain-containing protein [Chlorobiota bacterium]
MKVKLIFLFVAFTMSISFAQTPVAQWLFDDPANLTKADIGDDLILVGTDSAVAGPVDGDGAVSIGIGSHYIANPYLAPSGADTAKRVNIYTIVYDFQVHDLLNWHCFMQTDPTNEDDGEFFIKPDDGNVGVGGAGYTVNAIVPGEWYRLAIVVDLSDTSINAVQYYFDGVRQTLDREAHQEIDNRFSFGDGNEAIQLLLFADNSDEDDVMEVAKVSIYDVALTNVEVAALGGFKHKETENFEPIAQWDFDDPSNITAATIGTPLTLVGTAEVVAGPEDGNGAVSIGVGSYFKAATGIIPNGGGTRTNSYALSIDFKVNVLNDWVSLMQTNTANDDDGDLFLSSDKDIGIGALGWSDPGIITEGDWYRMVFVSTPISADSVAVDIYLDGILVNKAKNQTIDSRFSLEDVLLLFADNDGEDNTIEVAQVALYDSSLTGRAVAGLGGYQHGTVEESIVAWWKFDNPDSLTEATVGNPLQLVNKDGADPVAEAVAGPEAGDGAVKIGPRNHFVATPDMAPSGGGLKVNRYTIGFDFSVDALGNWRAFFQTDSLNNNDAEFFIKPSGEIGVGDLGYSDSAFVAPDEWYRLIITVDLLDTTTSAVQYYIDGIEVSHEESGKQKIDNRFSFGPKGYDTQLILFGDNDGDDGIINISQAIIFDRVLSAEEVEALGGYGHVVEVEEGVITPEVYSLNQNYPNPFNPTTIISYSIQKQSDVTLRVYNLLGELVTTLVDQKQSAGKHQIQFNANNLSTGVYFYSIKAGSFFQTKKMLLLK